MKKTFKRMSASICTLAIATSMIVSSTISASALSYDGSFSYESYKYYSNLQHVNLTGNPREDIVNVAKSQIGYSGSPTTADLSGIYYYPNNVNFTEYGRKIGCYGDDWAAVFLSWCADTAGIKTSIIPKHAAEHIGLNWFINKNQAYSRESVMNGKYTPKSGDIIYFGYKNTHSRDRVGLVSKYSNGQIYVIEGDSNNVVKMNSYDITNEYITYICKPAYENATTVKLDKTALTLSKGSAYTLKATTGSKLTTWTSSNKAVANVSTGGVVTAVSAGKATITVKLANGNKATCVITVPSVKYFPKCAASHTSIVNALNSIGANYSFDYRKKIAVANAISNYSGTAAQNTTMLKLLKNGKLIKP